MLNPKELRMSLRCEKKQVNFDPSAQPQSGPSAMFEAAAAWIRSGELSSVRESLKNRSLHSEERDENGQTLLLLAAQAGQASLCEDFLRHGWDPNADDSDGWTALHNAAKEGFDDVVVSLVTQGASVECRDGNGWTPLMWACYRGDTKIARFLLDNGAFTNVHDGYHMSPLIWASGRGHLGVVDMLLRHNSKVNAGDKFGSTALIWAARKGYARIVEKLLESGASVDTAGMFSWTALIVATKGNYIDIVAQLLEHKPNTNAVDVDGYTALAICCKEGFTEIAARLIAAGAYVNMLDKGGDTNLIHAAKIGNLSIVDVLLKRHADLDIQGSDKKTALYWAVEKGHADVVKSLLSQNPSLELATKAGDTPLMRATRNRNLELVTMLIERKNPAKVSACDKRGDTAIHIAMRARSKAICEVLLRNPKHGYLLYRPNKSGETPYNIDAAQQKSILQQIFGSRKLNTQEENENMLGYDLYSSSLADIFSEPSLTVPITVGLYARWGSGKSFLLNKLENELRSYEFQWMEQGFKYSWVLFITVCFYSVIFGYIIGLVFQMWFVAIAVSCSSVVLSYGGFYLMRYGSRYHDWHWAFELGARIDELLTDLKCVLQVLFCHPSNFKTKDGSTPVRFIFSNKTKVSSSGDGGSSIACLLASMYQALEEEFGYFTTRFYRAFCPKPTSSSTWIFRRMCCVPYWSVCVLTFFCMLITIELIISSKIQLRGKQDTGTLIGVMISFATFVSVVFVANLHTWIKMTTSLFLSFERSIHRYVARVDSVTQGGYSETLKSEVKVLCDMIHCMDSFMARQTRLVIIVDGLDSCEQTKVLSVLDAVNVMLSDPGMPFVIILAVDPHIVIKAIESNVSRSIQNPSLRGFDYLQNIVHLPFFLQNSGLRKVRAAARFAQSAKRVKDRDDWGEKDGLSSRRVSSCSAVEAKTKRQSSKGNQKLRSSESIASSIGNIHQRTAVSGGVDLTKVLLNDDYFSDINPRSMRRLMNILYVTGRLMRAFNIDFNWYHLALWVNLTEQWPCQTSWLIHHCETHEAEIDDTMPLRNIFETVRNSMPTSKEIEKLLTMDHDVKKLELFLSLNSQALQVGSLRTFIPFAINLDPYIRRVLQDSYHSQMERLDHSQTVQPKLNLIRMAGNRPFARYFEPPYMTTQPAETVPYAGSVSVDVPQQMYQNILPMSYQTPVLNPTLSLVLKKSGLSLPKEKLTSHSVDDVLNLLSRLEGISKEKLGEYQTSITNNNISGLVLFSCDLQELKSILGMSFGDWEIFRIQIAQMRNAELLTALDPMSPSEENKSLHHHYHHHHHPHHQQQQQQQQHNPNHHSDDAKHQARCEEKFAIDREPSKYRKSQMTTVKANITSLEKQVTMEENMIIGALETLNEEAFEEAASLNLKDMGSVATSLSPIVSDVADSTHSDSMSFDSCVSPRSQHTAPSSHRLQRPPDSDEAQNSEGELIARRNAASSQYSLRSLCTSVPDIEWGSTVGNAPSATVTASHPAMSLTVISNPLCNVLTSAPPSIASSPLTGQDSGFQECRTPKIKTVEANPPLGSKRIWDTGSKPMSLKVEETSSQDEKRPLLHELESLELPANKPQVAKDSVEYRRQHFGRQFSTKEEDRD